MQQIAKLDWLECGDENTKLFYQSIRQKRRHNNIRSIQVKHGKLVNTSEGVQQAFTQFYTSLLGSALEHRSHVLPVLMDRGARLTDAHREILKRDLSLEEIKKALMDIPNNKALGLDSYNNLFFKATWPIVQNNVSEAIKDFFTTRKILREVNVNYYCSKGSSAYFNRRLHANSLLFYLA